MNVTHQLVLLWGLSEARKKAETKYMHTASLERRDGLISGSSNHIKPEPLGKALMW